jgi:hypothetical protein
LPEERHGEYNKTNFLIGLLQEFLLFDILVPLESDMLAQGGKQWTACLAGIMAPTDFTLMMGNFTVAATVDLPSC